MFEAFDAIATAWRTVLHLSEWSGLSVGAVIGLGLLVYLDPAARNLALAAGLAVAIGFSCVVYGDSTGRADVQAQWDAEKAEAAEKAAAAARTAVNDDTARAGAIEAKAKEQHEKDLAEIARLKQSNACVFDDGDVAARSVRNGKPASAAVPVPVAKPAGAKADHEGAADPAPRPGLWLSLVRGFGLQGKGRSGDASPNGQ